MFVHGESNMKTTNDNTGDLDMFRYYTLMLDFGAVTLTVDVVHI